MKERWDWIAERPEGQFLERKSCYDREAGRSRPRALKDVLDDVAETLVAMANADGGVVAVGVEDEGKVTGVPERYSLERAKGQLDDHIQPRLRFRAEEIEIGGQTVWVFETDWSPEVHRLSDGRYLLRVHDQNQPFSAGDIEAMKASRRRRLTEAQFVSGAALEDLRLDLLQELNERSDLSLSPEETLIHYRLAEPLNGRWRVSLAALLLFGKDPARWHPRCGIEFIRWRGTQRRTGADLNVIKRIRMEAPLVRLIEEAFQTIQQHIPERQSLVDLFFQERFEYPTFAWQEAIVNAVAHRDYGLTGTPIEVHLFDDRMEIRSPGELVEPVTLERLRRRERVHASRNPRIVRVLVEFGYMRELGEGIPRMYEVMEQEGLHPPEFSLEGGGFVTTLYNEPIYRPETMVWLRGYEGLGLSSRQRRLLAYAHEHANRFTSREYQRLTEIGVYEAFQDIQELRRKGIVRLIRPKGRVYEVVEEAHPPVEKPPEFVALEPILQEQGFVKNEDICRVLNVQPWQARKVALDLVRMGWLISQGEKRGRRYLLPENIQPSPAVIKPSR